MCFISLYFVMFLHQLNVYIFISIYTTRVHPFEFKHTYNYLSAHLSKCQVSGEAQQKMWKCFTVVERFLDFTLFFTYIFLLHFLSSNLCFPYICLLIISKSFATYECCHTCYTLFYIRKRLRGYYQKIKISANNV